MNRTTAARTAADNRRGDGRPRLPCMSAAAPPASKRRFRRRTWRTVMPRAAATCAVLSRPLHSPFNNPGRCSSFRLNVKVSIEGGPFHGAVTGGHFHVAAALAVGSLTTRDPRNYSRLTIPTFAGPAAWRLRHEVPPVPVREPARVELLPG